MSLSTRAKRLNFIDSTDEGWEPIVPLAHGARQTGRLTTMDRRQVVNALL